MSDKTPIKIYMTRGGDEQRAFIRRAFSTPVTRKDRDEYRKSLEALLLPAFKAK